MSADFELELKQGFLEEASQLLSEAEQCFLTLESNPHDQPTLEKIFRIAHNIKGSSRAVGFIELGAFTHEFESYLLRCKDGEIAIVPEVISLLLKCTDQISQFIQVLKDNPSASVDCTALIEQIKNYQPGNSAVQIAPEPVAQATQSDHASESSEMPVALDDLAKLDKINAAFDELVAQQEESPPHQIEELQNGVVTPVEEKFASPIQHQSPPVEALPVPAQSTVAPTPEVVPTPRAAPKPMPASQDESIRVSLSRVEKLLNYVGEMVILQTVFKEQYLSSNSAFLKRTIDQMGKVTKEVQNLSMGLRMVPIKQTFQKMQRIVRDTSSVLGKKVNLILEGEETEVDKTVLEALGDPLVHLVRNAVDHGIELPSDRIAAGKAETGTIILRSYHQSGKLVIEVKDDGGGISAQRLREKAIEKRILKPGQEISNSEAIQLIFHPGFSTKTQVTEVSGRGVGMDVVKTNIEQLQGEVLVTTELGVGSTFKITLPLTLAIIDGMVVRCGDERFIIPLSHVHESVKTTTQELQASVAIGEVLLLRGENLPVLRLSQALGKKKKESAVAEEHQIAIIVRSQGKPFATIVDDIIGQHQVVIKKLGSEMKNISGFSGSAILGDGRPALILELGDLIHRSARNKEAV